MTNVSRVLCFAVLLAGGIVLATEARAGVASHSYAASSFALELDGVKCGFLKSAGGGGVYGEVVEETTNTYYSRKHLSKPRCEPIVLRFGFDIGGPVLPWIVDMLAGKSSRKNGSIIAVDYQGAASEALDFFNATVGEVRFPACDGGSKEPAYVTLTLLPESTRRRKLSGQYTGAQPAKQEQKVWLPSNFRVEIAGLPTARVNRVSEVVARIVTEIGPARDPRAAGRVEYANVSLTLLQADADPWYAWLEQFVVQGQNSDAQEKTVTLSFLTPNLQTELARLRLLNAGLVRFGAEKAEANGDQIRRVEAEMYCERVELDLKAGAPAATK